MSAPDVVEFVEYVWPEPECDHKWEPTYVSIHLGEERSTASCHRCGGKMTYLQWKE